MVANVRRFLIFFMHGKRYAFDLEYVAEIMDPALSYPIPFAPSCYCGAINFHGAIVAVIDLAFFLGFAPCPELEKLVVLDVSFASLGVLVERVERIVTENEVEFLDPPDEFFASALLRLPEGDATLLDLDAIISESENSINS